MPRVRRPVFVMAAQSGDLDPAIVNLIANKKGLLSRRVEAVLNQSGTVPIPH